MNFNQIKIRISIKTKNMLQPKFTNDENIYRYRQRDIDLPLIYSQI